MNDKKLYYPIIGDYLTHIRETCQPTNSYNDLISKTEKAHCGTRTDEFHHPQAWLDTPKIMEFTFKIFKAQFFFLDVPGCFVSFST